MEHQEIQANPVAEEVKNRPVNNKGKSYVIVREDQEIQGTSTEKKLPPQAIIPSKVYPPGYRFMPTDDELILEYLQKKIRNEPIPIDEISDVYLKENNPKALAETYPQLGENEWYFFTPRDRKYPNGSRPNRAADTGYWKATGADRPVRFEDKIIGFRKALVYYEGKPPKGQKTNWIMHEYRVDQPPRNKRNAGDMRLDDWVLCRIYEKASRPNNRINRRSGKDMSGDPLDDENPSHAVNTDEDDEIENPAAEARVLNDDEKVRINIAPAVVVDNNNENNLAPFMMPAAENVAMGHAHSSDEVLIPSTYGDWLQPSLQNLLINNSAVPPHHHSFMEEPPALINNGDLHLHQPILDNYGMLNQQNVFGTTFLNDEQEQLALGGDFQEGSWGTANNGTSHQVPASYFGPSSTNNTTFNDSFVTTVEDSFNSPDYNQLMPIEEKKTLKRFRY